MLFFLLPLAAIYGIGAVVMYRAYTHALIVEEDESSPVAVPKEHLAS